MASTRLQLRTKVLANMDGRSDTAITAAVNAGLDEACKVVMAAGGTGHRWRRLGTRVSSLATVADAQTVTLPAGCGAINGLTVLDETSSYRIEIRDQEWVERWLTAADQQATSKPLWAYREGASLYLAPCPDAAYTLRLSYEAELSLGAAATDAITAEGFDEVLVAYATSHAWGSVQHGLQQAQYWMGRFTNLLAALVAAEQKDQPVRGVDTRTTRGGAAWAPDPRTFTLPRGHGD